MNIASCRDDADAPQWSIEGTFTSGPTFVEAAIGEGIFSVKEGRGPPVDSKIENRTSEHLRIKEADHPHVTKEVPNFSSKQTVTHTNDAYEYKKLLVSQSELKEQSINQSINYSINQSFHNKSFYNQLFYNLLI